MVFSEKEYNEWRMQKLKECGGCFCSTRAAQNGFQEGESSARWGYGQAVKHFQMAMKELEIKNSKEIVQWFEFNEEIKLIRETQWVALDSLKELCEKLFGGKNQ